MFLEDSKQNAEMFANIDSMNCGVRFCRIILYTTGIFDFNITVVAVNAAGESRSATQNVSISKSFMYACSLLSYFDIIHCIILF